MFGKAITLLGVACIIVTLSTFPVVMMVKLYSYSSTNGTTGGQTTAITIVLCVILAIAGIIVQNSKS